MEATTLISLLNWTVLATLTWSAAWIGSKMQRRRIRISCERAQRHNR